MHWRDHISQDDECSAPRMRETAQKLLDPALYTRILPKVKTAQEAARARKALRIEGTLREFHSFKPVNLWFDYPIHHVDEAGTLQDVMADGEAPPWQQNFMKSGKRKGTAEERESERKKALETAFEVCGIGSEVTVSALAEYLGVSEKTARSRIKEHGGFWIDEGTVGKK